MRNYQDMNNEEIKEQLEWSDQHEFSYGYSMWAFKEIERLNNIIYKARKMIFDNYGILDKYEIEMLDDILDEVNK